MLFCSNVKLNEYCVPLPIDKLIAPLAWRNVITPDDCVNTIMPMTLLS